MAALVLITTIGGIYADAGLRAPIAALFTATIIFSRSMGMGVRYVKPRFLDASIGFGTVATAYLWLAHETGDPWIVEALPGDLLVLYATVPLVALGAALTQWAIAMDERRIKAKEEGEVPSGKDKEQLLFWIVSPITIAVGFGLLILAAIVAQD